MAPGPNLLHRVPDPLKPLSPLEEKLIRAAPLGDIASDFPPGPLDLAQIGDDQRVRSEVLVWLLTTPEVNQNIHYKGLRLRGAKITGVLDLEDAHVERPIALIHCLIPAGMALDRGRFEQLDCTGSHTGPIQAASIQVLHHLILRDGFQARGTVYLTGANIGGNLTMTGGEIEHPGGDALRGDGLTTKGDVFLKGGFKAKGAVCLPGATIGGNLECDGCILENAAGNALFADGLIAKGDVFLRAGFAASGAVRLLGADIGGDLDCREGTFANPGSIAFFGDRLKTQGGIYLRDGFTARGEVRLMGASVGGNLDCRMGKFENPAGNAFSADRITTRGTLYMNDGFQAVGSVYIAGASISGNMNCDSGSFENPGGNALAARGLTVKGNVFFRNGFKARGEVRLIGVTTGGDLDCSGAEFDTPGGIALNGDALKVAGSFVWRGLARKPRGIISLENANLFNLDDDEKSWPEPGSLNIDGLVYGPFTSHVPADAKSRLRWLNLRDSANLNVQPYEQLTSVFRQMGLRDDARDVAIARQQAIRRKLGGISRFWSWVLDFTIAYGYKPANVILLFILPTILLGILIFTLAFRAGLIESTLTPQQQAGKTLVFDPVGYSVDVFLPIVDLHQESAWKPDAAKPFGLVVQYYLYFHILAGWFFSTLAVAAVTGLVRRD